MHYDCHGIVGGNGNGAGIGNGAGLGKATAAGAHEVGLGVGATKTGGADAATDGWMGTDGACWCVNFSHTIHTTSKQMFQTLLSKQRRKRIFFVMPRFQHRFLVGKWFGGTGNVLN